MKNKKSKIAAAIASALVMSMPFAIGAPCAETADYAVDGGRLVVDFEDAHDIDKFSRFTEHGALPYAIDGRLYCSALAEQKLILKNLIFDDVQVDVDIYAIGTDGKFDGGVYIGASNANNAKDGITAWNVNIEHAVDGSTFYLKLHRFENNRWLREEMTEVGGLAYTKDYMHLRVVVKSGMLSAYLDYSETPTITKSIGAEARGMIGIRNFYSPSSYDNIVVVGDALKVDKSDMNALKSLAEERLKQDVTEISKAELADAVELAEAATSQSEADAAAAALSAALGRAEVKHTLEELGALVAEADKIDNEDNVYTGNSYASLVAVRDICSTLTEADGEYEISYWYARLEEKTKNLIAYSKESA